MPQGIEPGTVARAAVDIGAREEIEKLDARLKALELIFSDLAHSFWGDATLRNNGYRSRVRKLSARLAHLIDRMDESDKAHAHYLDKRRQETCHGIPALEKHLKEHDSMSAHDVAIEVAKIQAASNRTTARNQQLGMIIVGAMSLAAALVGILK
jgi:hypothetical protein